MALRWCCICTVKYLGHPLVSSNRRYNTCVRRKTEFSHYCAPTVFTEFLTLTLTRSKQRSDNFLFIFFSRRWTTFGGLEFAAMHHRGVGREIIDRITWNIRPNHTETPVTKTLKVCLFRAQLHWEKAQRKKVAKSFLFTAHAWFIWAGASAAEATTGDETVLMFLLLLWMRAVQRRLS